MYGFRSELFVTPVLAVLDVALVSLNFKGDVRITQSATAGRRRLHVVVRTPWLIGPMQIARVAGAARFRRLSHTVVMLHASDVPGVC